MLAVIEGLGTRLHVANMTGVSNHQCSKENILFSKQASSWSGEEFGWAVGNSINS